MANLILSFRAGIIERSIVRLGSFGLLSKPWGTICKMGRSNQYFQKTYPLDAPTHCPSDFRSDIYKAPDLQGFHYASRRLNIDRAYFYNDGRISYERSLMVTQFEVKST